MEDKYQVVINGHVNKRGLTRKQAEEYAERIQVGMHKYGGSKDVYVDVKKDEISKKQFDWAYRKLKEGE